jgi:hypothetical protein
MTSKFTELAIDCADPNGLARFWCSVLDYEVQDEDDGIVTIGSPMVPEGGNRLGPVPPTLTFAHVPEGKTVKNRLHLDVNPTDREQDGERVLRPCGPPALIGSRTPRQTCFRSPTHAHANTMRSQRWRMPTRARSNSANFLTHDTPPPTPARWTGATGQTTTQRSCGDRMGCAGGPGGQRVLRVHRLTR